MQFTGRGLNARFFPQLPQSALQAGLAGHHSAAGIFPAARRSLFFRAAQRQQKIPQGIDHPDRYGLKPGAGGKGLAAHMTLLERPAGSIV